MLRFLSKIYRKNTSPLFLPWKTKKGFSLLEILIAVGLLAILTGIGVVTYRSVIVDLTLKKFREISEFFPNALNSCIVSSGWEIDHPQHSIPLKPCNNLKKIDYQCPPDTTCIPDPSTDPPTDFPDPLPNGHICLDMRREIKNKKYQIYIIVNKEDRSSYEIRCPEVTSNYVNLPDADCQVNPDPNDDCKW